MSFCDVQSPMLSMPLAGGPSSPDQFLNADAFDSPTNSFYDNNGTIIHPFYLNNDYYNLSSIPLDPYPPPPPPHPHPQTFPSLLNHHHHQQQHFNHFQPRAFLRKLSSSSSSNFQRSGDSGSSPPPLHDDSPFLLPKDPASGSLGSDNLFETSPLGSGSGSGVSCGSGGPDYSTFVTSSPPDTYDITFQAIAPSHLSALSPTMSTLTASGSINSSSLPTTSVNRNRLVERRGSDLTTNSNCPSPSLSSAAAPTADQQHPHARILSVLELGCSSSVAGESSHSRRESTSPPPPPLPPSSLPLPPDLAAKGLFASDEGLTLPFLSSSSDGPLLDWDQLVELVKSPEIFDKLRRANKGFSKSGRPTTSHSNSSADSQSGDSDLEDRKIPWGLTNVNAILSHMIGGEVRPVPVSSSSIPATAAAAPADLQMQLDRPSTSSSSVVEKESSSKSEAPPPPQPVQQRPNAPSLEIHLATDDMVVYWCPELDAPVKDEAERKRKLGQKAALMKPLVKIKFTSGTYHKVFDKETAEEVFPYSGKGPGNDWIRGQALGIVKCTCTFNCLGTRSEDYFKRPSVLRKHFASCTSRHTNHPLRVLCKFQREAESAKTEGKSFGPRKKPARKTPV